MLFISFGGIRSNWNPNSTPIPAVQSATSTSLFRPIEGVEFKATLSQIKELLPKQRVPGRAPAFSPRRLEELDGVPIGIEHLDLFASRPHLQVVAKLESSAP